MAPTTSPALTNPRPLALLAPNEMFVLHCTAQFGVGKRTPVVLGDMVTAERALELIDEDTDDEYDDFLLCGDDGAEYVPCFRRRGWIKR